MEIVLGKEGELKIYATYRTLTRMLHIMFDPMQYHTT